MSEQSNQVLIPAETLSDIRRTIDDLHSYLGINKSFLSDNPPNDWAVTEDAVKLMNERAYEATWKILTALDDMKKESGAQNV